MAQIKLSNITKKYKDSVALKNLSLEVNDKEFIVLFGPAGAGKTTLLKVIAGLEQPQEGLVQFDQKTMNCIEPYYRNVSMVFENYALYPHMTVFDNIASPLRSSLYKEDKETIDKEVKRIASMMKIDKLLDRLPQQVSNGQKQRTALGRCLVRHPNVFLMDEPLAHLDAKLRHFMRKELKEMQSSFDTTTIYVTHDYTEALSLGDRIVVINHGEIQQIGSGDEIYYTPANEFVAKLMGEPEINIFNVEFKNENGRVRVKMPWVKRLFNLDLDVEEILLKGGFSNADIGIRGSDIYYRFDKEDEDFIKGSVYSIEPLGNKVEILVKIEEQIIKFTVPNNMDMEMDMDIFIKFNLSKAIFFNSESTNYIIRHNEQECTRGRCK